MQQIYIRTLNNGYNNGELEFNETFSYFRDFGDISSSRVIAISDYDNDGDQEVFVARKYGSNWLFENQTLTGSYDNVEYNPNPNPQFVEVALINNVQDDSFGVPFHSR